MVVVADGSQSNAAAGIATHPLPREREIADASGGAHGRNMTALV